MKAVVTGIGVVSSVGIRVENFWKSLINGKSGIKKLTRFDPKSIYSKIAGEVDFNPDFLDNRDLKRMDNFSLYSLGAANYALSDSGLDIDSVDPFKRGVIIGNGAGGLSTLESSILRLHSDKNYKRVGPFDVPKYIGGSAASNIAMSFGLQGPSLCVNSSCASSGHALGFALDFIRSQRAEIVLAGGSEAVITPIGLQGFCSARALSSRNDEPEKASRPFDRERDGFVMSEGSVVLVIESEELAKRRDAEIYCELKGSGFSCDAYHITDPNGKGAETAMRLALKDACVGLEEVDYVHAHGTSTKKGDIIETKAIKEVFGGLAYNLMISSTKSMTGHMIGAAGAAGAAVCALGIKSGIIPPTINYEYKDPECDLDYVPNTAREKEVRVCLNNSFGFGGQNACLVLSKY